ncbi:MAG: pyrroline-5-carboxylate reductase [Planctomycetes bacterium]|nr:pyrroline-5-carboxylate reductase [Planctomycetota bacterium]
MSGERRTQDPGRADRLPPIAFIGGGNMASAMIKSLAALPLPPQMTVSEPDPGKRASFTALGLTATADNCQATASARIVCLAIKPQMSAQVVPELGAAWAADKVLVSILAGMSTATLATWLPAGARVVRAMPNTPLAIGKGMVGLCRGKHASDADLALAEALFAPCARVLRVSDEARMDAVTAVSGSGPAYFFRFAEALVDAAVQLGFTRDEAILLVGQTGAGSWDYLLASGFEAKRLREQVTSPGGTTAAALQVLEEQDFSGIISRALAAAQRRGQELGRG